MVDFSKHLGKPIESAVKPKTFPAGTYHGTIAKYELKESKEKKTPYVRFLVDVTSAGEDVDPSLLDGCKMPRQMRRDYFFTEDAMYRFRELLESIFGEETKGRTFNELLPSMNGQAVVIAITQRPSDDGSELYNDIDKMFGATQATAATTV
jgi:hypothetical protein